MSCQNSFDNRRDPGVTSEDLPQFYHDALAVTQQNSPDRIIDPTTSMIPLINGQKENHSRDMNGQQQGGYQQQQRNAPVNNISMDQAEECDFTDDMRLADIRYQDDPFSAITVSVDQLGLDQCQEIDVLDLAGYKRGRHEDDEGDREPSKAAQRNPDTERIYARRRRASDAVKATPRATTNANKDSTKRSRKHKLLKPINALLGQPPLNIKEILSKIMIEIPITWIMQFSPFFRDGTTRLSSSPRPRRTKPKKKEDSHDEEKDQLYDTNAEHIQAAVRQADHRTKQLQQQRFSERAQQHLEIGDTVLLKNHHLREKSKQPPWSGLFKITGRTVDTNYCFTLSTMHGKQLFGHHHADNLKLFTARTGYLAAN
ncbi:unnamed protein product [Zymoseptoria tritici ST99CH_1E4]|uniref:Uncharacterized protein n=1 Tax=Zymoseptoria tritici ST99CH_1E4 TaxID=1276532 RepID=A0A2H1H9A7_ZYMTR|nr:unnamed protein product [Zymoseptoria tritici ST99CH_1E4]